MDCSSPGNPPSLVRKFSSVIGDDAIRFGDGEISVAPALSKDEGQSMSAYTSFFRAGLVPTCRSEVSSQGGPAPAPGVVVSRARPGNETAGLLGS